MKDMAKILTRLNQLLTSSGEIDPVDFADELNDFVPEDGRELESILAQEIPIAPEKMDAIDVIENSIKLLEAYVQIATDNQLDCELELEFKRAFQSVLSPLLAEMNTCLKKLVKLRQEKTPFKVRLWVEKMSDSSNSTSAANMVINVEDSIVIKCVTDRDCFLTLINIGPTGNLTLLFPNERAPSNSIRAEQIQVLPEADWGFKYCIKKPSGLKDDAWMEKIKAIATLTDVQLSKSAMPKTRSLFRTIPRGHVAKNIGDYVNAIVDLPSHQWSEASCQFEVKTNF